MKRLLLNAAFCIFAALSQPLTANALNTSGAFYSDKCTFIQPRKDLCIIL